MKKTFCDRCGKECINSVHHVQISVEHHTNRNENVGYDEYSPVDLCPECGRLVTDLIPAITLREMPSDIPMELTAQPRLAQERM